MKESEDLNQKRTHVKSALMMSKMLSSDDAAVMVTRDEDHFFDRKALAVSGKKVQKVAVAFANADGGEFVIGIADDEDEPTPTERWKGATKVEDFNPHLQAISDIKPAITADYFILEASDRTGLVLLVRIEKSSDVHQTTDGTVYVRKGAQSLPLKEHQRIMELQFAKGAASFEDQVLPGVPTEEVSEGAELQRFLNEYSPKSDAL